MLDAAAVCDVSIFSRNTLNIIWMIHFHHGGSKYTTLQSGWGKFQYKDVVSTVRDKIKRNTIVTYRQDALECSRKV